MEAAAVTLKLAFGYVVYPGAVLGVSIYLGIMVLLAIVTGRDVRGVLRRLAGALFPFVVLSCLVATAQDTVRELARRVIDLPLFSQLLVGAVVAIVVMESSKQLLDRNGDLACALQNLLMSTLGSFLVWVLMEHSLELIKWLSFGLLATGMLHIILRGLPRIRALPKT
jgi:hypothetical protein